MAFYVYIIYSENLDKYYVGHSDNPWRRLVEHQNSEGKKFTAIANDWVLKAVFFVSENREDAMKLEKFIKKQKTRSIIEKLVDKDFTPNGILAQLVRVPHVRD